MKTTIPELLSSPLAMLPSSALALLERYRIEMRLPPTQAVALDSRDTTNRSFSVIGNVAIVPVCGVLTHEEPYCWEDATSYGGIRKKLTDALGDESIKGILLEVNSPGGTVSGCFDLCDDIYGMRGSKPLWVVVDESAFSAAYAISSSADRIIVPRTGGVGSVGVITMHIDITKMLEDFGVKVTTIQFGERKSDSYPTTPLSKEAQKRLQAEVDTLGEMFVSMVSRNRSMSAKKVRDTEAGTFLGESGVEVGFADAVMPATQALLEFLDYVKD